MPKGKAAVEDPPVEDPEEPEETGEEAEETPTPPSPEPEASSSKPKAGEDRTAKLEREIAALNKTMEGLLDRSVDSTTRGDVRSEIARALKEADTETKVNELTEAVKLLAEQVKTGVPASSGPTRSPFMQTMHRLMWGGE